MERYHKIQTIFDRDPDVNFRYVIPWSWALEEFAYLADNIWHFTEKIDGTNIRVIWEGQIGLLSFNGKTDNAQIPAHLVNKLRERFPDGLMEKTFQEVDVCLYGEGYGVKIQKGGGYIPDGVDFILFDVRIGKWWLKRADVEDVAKKLGIETVPLLGSGSLYDAAEMVERGFKSAIGNRPAEGLVVRCPAELFTRNGQRLIGKLKTKDFPQ